MSDNRKKKPVNDSAEARLAQLFCRNGSLRLPNQTRQRKEGHTIYKKGYEIRFVAGNKTELKEISRLLKQAGFKPGAPYQKGYQFVQPVYGKDAVTRFSRVLLSQDEAKIKSEVKWLKQNQAFLDLLGVRKNRKRPPAKAGRKLKP